MTRVLVTGGAGFIGSHLVERILSDGAEVTCVDNFDPYYDPKIKEKNIEAAIKNPRFRLERADICDRDAMQRLFAKARPQIVVHLAARAGVRPSLADPVAYYRTNVEGTLHALEASRDSGASKFVFGSSSSVYGISSKVPFAEDDPLHCPISPYAVSKITAETLCLSFQRLFGLAVVCLRFFTVYGPRQRPEMAIAKFVRSMREGRVIDMYGDGKSLRDYTYVDDIVDGVTRAMHTSLSQAEVINLGESKAIALNELFKILEEETGIKPQLRRLPDQAGDVPVTFADVRKAGKLLGYKPGVTVREGVRRYWKWLNA